MIRQYKLTNGDELIAEVVEFIEEEDLVITKNTMKIVSVDDHQNGVRYYTFRPWMVYQDNEEYVQTIAYQHIVGEAKPNPLMLGQYNIALKKEIKNDDIPDYDEYDDDDELTEDNVIKFNKDKLH